MDKALLYCISSLGDYDPHFSDEKSEAQEVNLPEVTGLISGRTQIAVEAGSP